MKKRKFLIWSVIIVIVLTAGTLILKDQKQEDDPQWWSYEGQLVHITSYEIDESYIFYIKERDDKSLREVLITGNTDLFEDMQVLKIGCWVRVSGRGTDQFHGHTVYPAETVDNVSSKHPEETPVQTLQKLFGDKGSRYHMALNGTYGEPRELALAEVFANGFFGEPLASTAEEEELNKLYQQFDPELDTVRLRKEDMEQALQQYFGIGLKDLPEASYQGLYYLERTDCYYLNPGNFVYFDFQLQAVTAYPDGTVQLTYQGKAGKMYEARLKPFDEGYHILSNRATEPADEKESTLEAYQQMFATYNSWYNMALASKYDDPRNIRLYHFFYNGVGEDKKGTDAEWNELKNHAGFQREMDLIRLPKAKMDQILRQYFGIGLADMSKESFQGLVYLESTECYYMCHTDFHCVEDFRAVSVQKQDDGTILLNYTSSKSGLEKGVVHLKPVDGGYQILFNRESK